LVVSLVSDVFFFFGGGGDWEDLQRAGEFGWRGHCQSDV
jgi:hypothetical protein